MSGLISTRRRRQVVHLLHGHAHGIGAVEGQLARGGLVQHDAQRVDVAGGGEVLALRLLRRDVVRRAQHGRGLCHDGVLRARDAEVHDLHVAVGLHHDVLRLDVAVDDVQIVRHGEGLAHLRADLGDLALVDGAALVDGRLQVGSAHELHDDVVGAVVLAPVVHVHDVGALQVGGGGGLLLEALGEVGVGGVLGQHDLHGDQTAQHVVLRAVHLGHAADADALGYLVAVVEHPACHVSGHVSCSFRFTCSVARTACRCYTDCHQHTLFTKAPALRRAVFNTFCARSVPRPSFAELDVDGHHDARVVGGRHSHEPAVVAVLLLGGAGLAGHVHAGEGGLPCRCRP